MEVLQNILGIVIFLALAFAISENKKSISIKNITLTFFWLLVISFATKTTVVTKLFSALNVAIASLAQASTKATSFVFGYLATGSSPFALASDEAPYILALQSFPVIILVSSILSVLFYLGVMQFIIKHSTRFFTYTLRIGSALGTGCVANIFVGLAQSPLIIKPYLQHLTRSEMFAFICCGLAGSASAIAIIYADVLNIHINNAMGHITTAMLMNIFTALGLARIVIPETQKVTGADDISYIKHASFTEALSQGIIDGGKVVINVILMIIGFLSFIYFVNTCLQATPLPSNLNTIEDVVGLLISPFAWLMGISEDNMLSAGSILASKLVMNELIAYKEFIYIMDFMSQKEKIIMVYAICGFANLSSLGVIMGSYSVLVPNRKLEVISYVGKALIVGTLANMLTGCLIGLVY